MSFKDYFEGTVAADVAQATGVKKIQKRTPEHEKCMNNNDEDCKEELQGLDESPVGQAVKENKRTDFVDRCNLVRDTIEDILASDLASSRLKKAINNLLDIMDTDG